MIMILYSHQPVFNLKHVNGEADCTGPAVQLGAEEKYFPTCFNCYRASLIKAKQMPLDSHWLSNEGYDEKVHLNQVQFTDEIVSPLKGSKSLDENKENEGPNTVFNTVSPEK